MGGGFGGNGDAGQGGGGMNLGLMLEQLPNKPAMLHSLRNNPPLAQALVQQVQAAGNAAALINS